MKKRIRKVVEMKQTDTHPENTNSLSMSLDGLATKLQDMVADRSDTFSITEGIVSCDLGGTFTPTCSEMHQFASHFFKSDNSFLEIDISNILSFKEGESFAYNNQALRCYYEYYKKGTSLNYLKARVLAQGVFEISVMAQGTSINKVVQSTVVDFGDAVNVKTLPRLALAILPVNASLYITARCLSEKGFFHGFRWLGEVPQEHANTGERVIVIRTFGCKTEVLNSLTQITQRLVEERPELLRRHIFVVYDASDGDSSVDVGKTIENIRVLELKGPNYGGGGNASLLVSALLRVSEQSARYIDEVIIMDDDAKIDAETLVRHDAFVTARKEKIISSAVVYQAANPSIIQEFGGFWGRFFNEKNNDVTITEEKKPRLFFPYLIRNSRDMFKPYDCKYVSIYQDAEFATFIFISFPYQVLRKAGAPVPFFLRNDDVEICLRCREQGAMLVINPNIHAWHETAHNPVSEFYSVLHGLIVNNTYGGLSREYVYTTFMERTARLAKVGNCVVLAAYAMALKLFTCGPGWMKDEDPFPVYKECAANIKRIQADVAKVVPFEVYDKNKDQIDVYNVVDILPKTSMRKEIVFYDVKTNAYYHFDEIKTSNYIIELLEQCITYIHIIHTNFDTLSQEWEIFVKKFSHLDFWDSFLNIGDLQLQFERAMINEIKTTSASIKKRIVKISTQKQEEQSQLPMGFTDEGYLSKNPDVAQSGMTPKQHWLKYGQFEGRQY